MSARRLLGLVGGLALLAGCLAKEALCTPADSTYSCCVKQHAARPQSCGAEPSLSGTAMATGTLVAAATLSSDEAVLPVTTRDAVEKALRDCAVQAHALVNQKYFGGEPTSAQCNEIQRREAGGRAVTWAMKLGEDKHAEVLSCVKSRLNQLIRDRFSLEQRYRRHPTTGQLEQVTLSQREDWLKKHQGHELKGSVVPDIVIHSGDPLKAQAVYDFKFPCLRETLPKWTRYEEGHPHEYKSQGEVYEEFFGVRAHRVTPWEFFE